MVEELLYRAWTSHKYRHHTNIKYTIWSLLKNVFFSSMSSFIVSRSSSFTHSSHICLCWSGPSWPTWSLNVCNTSRSSDRPAGASFASSTASSLQVTQMRVILFNTMTNENIGRLLLALVNTCALKRHWLDIWFMFYRLWDPSCHRHTPQKRWALQKTEHAQKATTGCLWRAAPALHLGSGEGTMSLTTHRGRCFTFTLIPCLIAHTV